MRALTVVLAAGFLGCQTATSSSPAVAVDAASPEISATSAASANAADLVDASAVAANTPDAATPKSKSAKHPTNNAESDAEKRQLERLDAMNRGPAIQNALNNPDIPPVELSGASSATPHH